MPENISFSAIIAVDKRRNRVKVARARARVYFARNGPGVSVMTEKAFLSPSARLRNFAGLERERKRARERGRKSLLETRVGIYVYV